MIVEPTNNLSDKTNNISVESTDKCSSNPNEPKASHTPGPYTHEKATNQFPGLLVAPNGRIVCYFPQDDEGGLATATLFKAAPELLEALIVARGCLIEECLRRGEAAHFINGKAEMRIIEAAIAKAEGRA